MEKSKAK
jgi:CRP-like cAMP-binding protein